MSRHRTIPSGRPRAIALIALTAASALSAAAVLSAAGAPAVPGVTIPDRLAPPPASPQAVSLAVRVSQIHAVQAGYAAAKWQDARRAARRRDEALADQSQAAAQPAGITTAYTVASGSPEQIAEAMLGSFGWSSSQFSCLYPLWEHESGWSVTAENPGTGAYGIPQAMPGAKMASAGPDWQDDAATQIRWGLEYMKDLYGSPCGAWAHEQATGWY